MQICLFPLSQLVLNAVVGVECQSCHRMQQRALGFAEVVAIKHIYVASIAVGCPKVLGISHASDEMHQAFLLA